MSPESPAATRRILLADDDEILRDLVLEVLMEAGFWVHPAASHEIAIKLLGTTWFDLVLADSFGSTAKTAAKNVEALRLAAGGTPVVLFTAHALDVESARVAGFRGVITNPSTLSTSCNAFGHCSTASRIGTPGAEHGRSCRAWMRGQTRAGWDESWMRATWIP